MLHNFAFIDSNNLYQGTRELGWNLDYQKFRNYLKTKYDAEKAYLFIGYIPSNSKLYNQLCNFGYTLIFKPVSRVYKGGGNKYKGNVDAELVLYTIVNIKKYNKAIIVSGDGDFYCLIKHLVTLNKLEKIITPNNKYSSLIKEYSSYVFPLTLTKKKLCYKDKK